MISQPPNVESRRFLFISVCIGNLISFSMGIAMGWSSPINAMLNDESRLDENPFGQVINKEMDSWIGSLLILGATFGPFIGGFSMNRFGRKRSLIFCCGFPLFLSYLILAFARTPTLYYVARFIGGLGIGSVFTILPIFSSEIAEVSIRGLVSSSMNVFMVSGQLFAYSLGPYVPVMWFNLACALWPAAFIVLFGLFVPESPYYLVAKGEHASALESLQKFRSSTEPRITKEMETIQTSVEESMRNRGNFLDIFRSRGLIKALVISLSLIFFQQFSGINAVLFYSQDIFEAVGNDTIPPEISSIIVGVVRVLSSFVTPLVVDRAGRKLLHLISAVGMVLSLVPLGLYFFLEEHRYNVDAIFWLPVLCMIAYIITYNLGFGSLPWTVMAESFPANLKAPASTATSALCCLLGFLIAKFFSAISAGIGIGGAFWLFSGFCALAIVFVAVYMVETKGKTFDEIQELLAK